MSEYAAGASSSINKTITEIIEFLDIDRPAQLAERELRAVLHAALADLGESSLRLPLIELTVLLVHRRR